MRVVGQGTGEEPSRRLCGRQLVVDARWKTDGGCERTEMRQPPREPADGRLGSSAYCRARPLSENAGGDDIDAGSLIDAANRVDLRSGPCRVAPDRKGSTDRPIRTPTQR